ncbi:uncharacterized protein LOC142922903 isoform X2 [Petromyzon marinus]|uniref:uncharacterized protein LOC142922903 isoform X2 n=1 Tax=Petromyzon marinus TaxID=7757 RepID=UPI003F6EA99D
MLPRVVLHNEDSGKLHLLKFLHAFQLLFCYEELVVSIQDAFTVLLQNGGQHQGITDNRDQDITDNRDQVITDDRDQSISDNRDQGITDDRDQGITDDRDQGITDNRDQGITDNRDQGISDDRDQGITDIRDQSISDNRDQGITDDRDQGISDDRDQGITDDRNQGITDNRDQGISGESVQTADLMKLLHNTHSDFTLMLLMKCLGGLEEVSQLQLLLLLSRSTEVNQEIGALPSPSQLHVDTTPPVKVTARAVTTD